MALPLGRAKLATSPAATRSMADTKTIGMVRVACRNGATAELVRLGYSGRSATNSVAYL